MRCTSCLRSSLLVSRVAFSAAHCATDAVHSLCNRDISSLCSSTVRFKSSSARLETRNCAAKSDADARKFDNELPPAEGELTTVVRENDRISNLCASVPGVAPSLFRDIGVVSGSCTPRDCKMGERMSGTLRGPVGPSSRGIVGCILCAKSSSR